MKISSKLAGLSTLFLVFALSGCGSTSLSSVSESKIQTIKPIRLHYNLSDDNATESINFKCFDKDEYMGEKVSWNNSPVSAWTGYMIIDNALVVVPQIDYYLEPELDAALIAELQKNGIYLGFRDVCTVFPREYDLEFMRASSDGMLVYEMVRNAYGDLDHTVDSSDSVLLSISSYEEGFTYSEYQVYLDRVESGRKFDILIKKTFIVIVFLSFLGWLFYALISRKRKIDKD